MGGYLAEWTKNAISWCGSRRGSGRSRSVRRDGDGHVDLGDLIRFAGTFG
jgi:hypothetical protein